MKSKKQLKTFAKNRNKDTTHATQARVVKANKFALNLEKKLTTLAKHGVTTLADVAHHLTLDKVKKPRGGTEWSKTDVKRLKEKIHDAKQGHARSS